MSAELKQHYEVRSEDRAAVELTAWYVPSDQSRAQRVIVKNLSQSGAKIEFANCPDRSRRFYLALSLPGEGGSKRVECEWRWQINCAVGVQFVRPLPFDLMGQVLAGPAQGD
ncbi:MAG: PilZ domain-containing protein [Hyphomonas sp.]|nr:PilZ domain-containing protein [Hyphomonas sp.]